MQSPTLECPRTKSRVLHSVFPASAEDRNAINLIQMLKQVRSIATPTKTKRSKVEIFKVLGVRSPPRFSIVRSTNVSAGSRVGMEQLGGDMNNVEELENEVEMSLESCTKRIKLNALLRKLLRLVHNWLFFPMHLSADILDELHLVWSSTVVRPKVEKITANTMPQLLMSQVGCFFISELFEDPTMILIERFI
ncbi:hypothetical protein R1sor_018908 [Riccia sorocarpa]|uniref:Uncharacterized protein n=1 Tax=Riccia sorocarpa TaxID=122646 RepID=A0ABD3IF55_9MARC